MLLRDQRALNDWLKTPLKCRKYFCNNLTPDLPPVPVPFVSQKVQATLPPVCNKANEDLNHVQQYSLGMNMMINSFNDFNPYFLLAWLYDLFLLYKFNF